MVDRKIQNLLIEHYAAMLVLHSTERYSSSNASSSAWIVNSVNLSSEILRYIQSNVNTKGNGLGKFKPTDQE